MSLADACGPVGLGFVLVGMMMFGGSTVWLFPALICVVIGLALIAVSR